jgi:hypothetical protein
MVVKYISRTQWGAKPPATANGRFTPLRKWRVQGVVVHHGGVKHPPKGVAAVKAFERHHLSKGWDGIAYNWLVDETGTIFEGRGWGARGGATKWWNSKSVSVCYTGWGHDPVGVNVLESIKALTVEAGVRFGKLWVSTHRLKGSTDCPGGWLADWVEAGMVVDKNPSDQDWVGVVAHIHFLKAEVAKKPLSRWRRSRGEAVRLVQTRLLERGFAPGPADGIYGKGTAAAVKAFQRTQGWLKADGVVGVNTFTTLFVQ